MKIFILLFCISFNAIAIDQEKIAKIQKTLDLQTQNRMHVGISVGLVEGNKTHIINSGYKDLKNNIHLSNSDYFSIGSVSKTFTSVFEFPDGKPITHPTSTSVPFKNSMASFTI